MCWEISSIRNIFKSKYNLEISANLSLNFVKARFFKGVRLRYLEQSGTTDVVIAKKMIITDIVVIEK